MDPQEGRERHRKYVQSLRDAAANIRGTVAAYVENLTEAQIEKIHKIVHQSISITHDSAFIQGYAQGFERALEKAAKFAEEHGCSDVEKIHNIPMGGQIVLPPIKYKD